MVAENFALLYLSRGWSAVPVVSRGKQPLVRWQEFQNRSASVTEVHGWFRRWPQAGVGIVTGRLSGLVVVDVDPQHGGEESLAFLQRQHGAIPETSRVLTGSGGRHWYFAHPGGWVGNRAGVMPGIDVRGDGGYVVAPPSLHASGRAYEWEGGNAPWSQGLATFPRWLLEITHAHLWHGRNHWQRVARGTIQEGERNVTLASFTGHLLWHGVDPEIVLSLMLGWNTLHCNPPLPEDEVVRTVESISRLHLQNSSDRH